MAVCKRRRSKLGSTAAQFQFLLCCLFLTILQVATVSGQQTLLPRITQHPVGGIFAQDSTVELNCEASSGHGDETPPTYQWVRDNEDVANSGNSLVIQSLNVATSGSYACLATFNLETVISAAAEVQLITLEANVLSNSESSPHLTSVVAGIPDSISCSSPPATGIPSPETVWKVMLGNSYLDIAGSPNTLPGIDGRLYFLQPSEDNARLYRCEVTAVTASDNLDTFGYIELSVTDNSGAPSAPVFLLEPQDTTVNVGDNAYFQCIVGGDPLPETIEWFINTQDTESTLKRVLYFDDRSRVLVTGVDSMDVGTYTCAAAGLENSSATLTVRGIPEITTQTPESQSVEYGQAVSLACQLDPSSLDVSFQWFHNGVLLPSETGPVLTTLDAAELSDEGVYQCFAVNPAGSTSIAFHISVITIDAAFTEGGELTDQLAFIGLPFVMHCSATGAPPPIYTWYKSGVLLSESESLSFPSPPDGTLTILDVTDSHAGLYTCEAQNMLPETGVVIHTVSSSAELRVIAATTLVESIENPFTIQLGGNAELPCVASSESGAELNYTWTKDGALLEVRGSNHRVQWVEEGGGGGGRSGSLRIITVKNGDAGTYQCTVETMYGGLSAQPVASELSKVSVEAGPVKPLVTRVEALNSTAIMVLWLFQADSTNLLQFTVQTKRSREEDWPLDGVSTMPQAITQAAVHGLSPFTKYLVRVLAVYADGSVGVSDSSMEVSTLEAPPTLPPSGLMAAVTEDNMGLNLFWEAPPVGGRNGLLVDYTVQFYQVDDDDKTPSERSVGGNATNYLLTGLAPLTEYSIRVAASTSVGMGPYSDSIMIKTDYRGGVEEPTQKPLYAMIWFITVMTAIGVLIALMAFIVMFLVIWNCRKRKQKIYRVRGGQRGNTDDISLREDVVADYENRSRKSTEVLTYGSRKTSMEAFDLESSIAGSSSHYNTSTANGFFGPNNYNGFHHHHHPSSAPAYIYPPAFEEAVAHLQRSRRTSTCSTIDKPDIPASDSRWSVGIESKSSFSTNVTKQSRGGGVVVGNGHAYQHHGGHAHQHHGGHAPPQSSVNDGVLDEDWIEKQSFGSSRSDVGVVGAKQDLKQAHSRQGSAPSSPFGPMPPAPLPHDPSPFEPTPLPQGSSPPSPLYNRLSETHARQGSSPHRRSSSTELPRSPSRHSSKSAGMSQGSPPSSPFRPTALSQGSPRRSSIKSTEIPQGSPPSSPFKSNVPNFATFV